MPTVRTNRLPTHDAQGAAALQLAEIPQRGSFDVVVVGGGTGGAPAAIVAGQEGLKTAVIEPQSFLGGIGTGGGIHMYYHGLQTGIQLKIDARTDAWTKRIGGKASGFHPEAKKLALQELADAAGVKCFYRSFFVGAVLDGEKIVGIVAQNDAGLYWLEAKTVIDATGDADVAAAAGAPFAFGRDGDGAPQPFAPGLLKNAEAVSFRNFDAGYVDPTNALDQTRAQLEGRSHLALEKYDDATRMLYVSPVLGLRESRFIDAEYVVTLADQRACTRFPDVVTRAKAHYDNHAFDYENESVDAQLWVGAFNAWHMLMMHDVPYRCLLPKRVENLIVACRAAGMSHDAHNLFRMQRDIQALGEAAAVACAVAIRGAKTLRGADVKSIQKRLVERNALDAGALGGRGLGSTLPAEAPLAAKSVSELCAELGSNRETDAFAELVRRGADIHRELVAELKSDNVDARFIAAQVLAVHKRPEGVEILKDTVRARRGDWPNIGYRAQLRWKSAFFLLDYLGLRQFGALDLAQDLLKDTPLDHQKAVTAIRALTRHGRAEEVLPALRAVLARTDIDCKLVLQASMGPAGRPIVQDRRFMVELTAAEAFAKYNAPEEAAALAEKWAADPRALVRNLAHKVLNQLEVTAAK